MSSRSEISCGLQARVALDHVEAARERRPASRRCGVSICAQPRIAFSGVRSSCETVATNSSLSRLARSASRARRALALEQLLALALGRLLLALGCALLGDVAEHEHDAHDLAVARSGSARRCRRSAARCRRAR